MKIELRYFSRSGNTKKVAEAMAAAINVTAKPVTEDVSPDTDILFLGGAVYAFGIDDALKTFIANLSGVKSVAVFSTTAVVKSAYSQIKPLLSERGITVLDAEFHCRGAFKFMHKERPNAEDLQRAEEFAKEIVSTYGS